MTAKEKAYELIDKMHNVDITDDYEFPAMQMRHVIKCALIAVDEIMKSEPTYTSSIFQGSFLKSDNTEYWEEVKQEIQKL